MLIFKLIYFLLSLWKGPNKQTCKVINVEFKIKPFNFAVLNKENNEYQRMLMIRRILRGRDRAYTPAVHSYFIKNLKKDNEMDLESFWHSFETIIIDVLWFCGLI